MTDPFLKERWGWIESDVCWWCGTGKQTRVYCFRECIAWRGEIRELWKGVGLVRKKRPGAGRIGSGRKGFRYGVCQGAGPGNTNVRELLPNERCTLEFLRATKVGEIKSGIIRRG